MHKSKKIYLSIFVFTAIFGLGIYYTFIRVKPLLPPSEVNKDNIAKEIFKTEPDTPERKIVVARLAASIKQLPQIKQRGLWYELAEGCHWKDNQAITFYTNEISCWPQDTKNPLVAKCYASAAQKLSFRDSFKLAEKYFIHSLQITPNNLHAMHDYCYHLKTLKRYKEALPLAKAIITHPEYLHDSYFGDALEIYHLNDRFYDGVLLSIDSIPWHDSATQQDLWAELGNKFNLYSYSLVLAEIYYNRAAKLSLKLDDDINIRSIYNDLGQVAKDQDKFIQARKYYQMELKYTPVTSSNYAQLKSDIQQLEPPSVNDKYLEKLLYSSVYSQDIRFESELLNSFIRWVKKEPERTLKLFRKVAKDSNQLGIYLLAYCLDNGIGTQRNELEAVKWYKIGTKLGNANCQYFLGCKKLEGKVVPKDLSQAVLLLKKAAKQWHSDAQFMLGEYLFKTARFEQDKTEAIKWLRLSAEQGNKKAIRMIKNNDYIQQRMNDNKPSADYWKNKAIKYQKEKYPLTAIDCLEYALKIYEKKKDLRNQADVLTNMGQIITDDDRLADKNKGIEYLDKAIVVLKKLPIQKKELIALGNTYLLKGRSLGMLEKWEPALKVFKMSMDQFQAIDEKDRTPLTYDRLYLACEFFLGCCIETENYSLGINTFKKIEKKLESQAKTINIVAVFACMAQLYLDSEEYALSQKYCHKVLFEASKLMSDDKLNCAVNVAKWVLAQAYYKDKKISQAILFGQQVVNSGYAPESLKEAVDTWKRESAKALSK